MSTDENRKILKSKINSLISVCTEKTTAHGIFGIFHSNLVVFKIICPRQPIQSVFGLEETRIRICTLRSVCHNVHV